MTDAFLDELVRVHDTALRRFQDGCYITAKIYFSQILTSVRRYLRETADTHSDLDELESTETSSSDPGNRLYSITNYLSSFVETTTMAPAFLLEDTSRRLHDANMYIFPFPLQLPEAVSMDQFSFITLFNLALSSLLATEESETEVLGRGQELQKSLELWELVHWSHSENHQLMISKAQELAILTNMGYLHTRLGNSTASAVCYLAVSRIISAANGGDPSLDNDIPFKAFFSYVALQGLGVAAAA